MEIENWRAAKRSGGVIGAARRGAARLMFTFVSAAADILTNEINKTFKKVITARHLSARTVYLFFVIIYLFYYYFVLYFSIRVLLRLRLGFR